MRALDKRQDTFAHDEHHSRLHNFAFYKIPRRFEAPRLILYVATTALLIFGLLMVFSASSITTLTSANYGNDSLYFLKRQMLWAAIGIAGAFLISRINYHFWSDRLLLIEWAVTTFLLVLVIFLGSDVYGATRSIEIFGFRMQPSEFAKLTVILTAANLCQKYFEEGSLSYKKFLGLAALGVFAPLLLILFQPDKGTTLICLTTFVILLYLSGFSVKILLLIASVGAIFLLYYSLRDSYSRQRILTMFNPWSDPDGAGYQLIQGFYAFGTGGIFGVGIGGGRQKYSYLPMAHNDFILAVVGEECGFIGLILVLLAFAAILWAGFQIARFAPDLSGRLIAAGSVSMLLIQLFVNICGVLGIIPLSGKPVPFLSYGGSSVISSLLLIGLAIGVSRSSNLEKTAADRRREDMSLKLNTNTSSYASASFSRDFRVIEGRPSKGSKKRQSTNRPSYKRSKNRG